MTAKVTLAAIAALDVDYVVLDLGPPDSTLTLDLWLAADIPILVSIPDPASIEATYRFAKSAFVRRLRTIRGLDRLIPNTAGPPPGALDIYRAIKESGGPAERLVQEVRRYRPAFIMNQTRTLPDQKLGGFMATAARRRLGHPLEYLGHVESDETVWLAARRRRSLIAEYPEGKASKNIERLGRRLLTLDGERERERPVTGPLRVEEEQTYYEILETEPGVSDEEIRRAHRTVKDNYASGSMLIAGLYDEHELAALHARINAAHDTLFAPDRRRLYDLALPEADLARAVRAAASLPRPAGAAGGVGAGAGAGADERADAAGAVIDSSAEVTGAFLRKVREIRGLELGDIAQRTKINERYLRALEEEQFADMPAAVYVRGYVTEYARALRLDPQRAAESYLVRYRAKLPKAVPVPAAPAEVAPARTLPIGSPAWSCKLGWEFDIRAEEGDLIDRFDIRDRDREGGMGVHLAGRSTRISGGPSRSRFVRADRLGSSGASSAHSHPARSPAHVQGRPSQRRFPRARLRFSGDTPYLGPLDTCASRTRG
jgi:flagellar biosynthesis protein FlhG